MLCGLKQSLNLLFENKFGNGVRHDVRHHKMLKKFFLRKPWYLVLAGWSHMPHIMWNDQLHQTKFLGRVIFYFKELTSIDHRALAI